MPARTPSLRDAVSRRAFLGQSGAGMGSAALAALLSETASGQTEDSSIAVPLPHVPAQAKHLIFLFMAGAPSQLDLFDYKPVLSDYHGKTADRELLGDVRFQQLKPRNKNVPSKLLGTPYKFRQHGASGAWVSELLPHFSTVVDEVAFLKGMTFNEQIFDHPFAQLILMTGAPLEGRPTLGAWLSYGLGNENANLPAYVVLMSNLLPRGGPGIAGSGFLPSVHHGVTFSCHQDPVLFLSNPPGVNPQTRRRTIDAINSLNGLRRGLVGDPEISARIAAFELAFRMQTSAPELVDLAQESKHTLEMYGAEPGKQSFANNCLMARRLVERGVRTVQLVDLDWDHHGDTQNRDLMHALPRQAASVDQAVTALLRDLDQRGLLEDTLVVWAAEFGRTPIDEKRGGSVFLGRDHHPFAGTFWLAGAGVKKGMTLGATDELGFHAVQDATEAFDVQATILHLMGLDHERLTYRHQGRDFRLTDVYGRVIREVLEHPPG